MNIIDMICAWQYWLFVIVFILLGSIHKRIFIKYFLAKKKYALYILGVILLIGISQIVKPFESIVEVTHHKMEAPDKRIPPEKDAFKKPPPKPKGGFGKMAMPPEKINNFKIDITTIYLLAILIAIGLAQYLMQHLLATEREKVRIENEKTAAELQLLKSQVHPHFLFNTLNNIYGLVINHQENAGDSILKLSNLMRYFLEEYHNDEVLISDEVSFIKDYIDLQKLRLSANCKVIEEYDGIDIDKKIAPFILLPFVENAFKYGVSKREDCQIRIQLQVDSKQLLFKTQNNNYQQTADAKYGYGLGISNTKKLLEHLYPNLHQLTINNDGKIFSIDLKIDLNE